MNLLALSSASLSAVDWVHVAALIAAYSLAFARLFDAARWAWAWLPAPLQPVAPVFLTFLTDLATGMGGAKDFNDVARAVLIDLGPLAAALRGALPPAHFARLDPASKDALAIARVGKKVPADFRSSYPPPAGLAAFAVFAFLSSVGLAVTQGGCSQRAARDVTTFVEDVVTQALAKSTQLTSVLDQVESSVSKLGLPEPASTDLRNLINVVRVTDQAAVAEIQNGSQTVAAAEAAYAPVRDAFNALVAALKQNGVVGPDGNALKAVKGEPALNLKPLALEPFRS